MGAVMNYSEYDPSGHLLSDAYYAFDPEDHSQVQLAVRKDWDYAVMEQEFDGPNMTVKRYLDAEENLTVPEKIGYALCELEYDDAGQIVRWAYYDAEGNLVVPVGQESAIVERIYDDTGNYVGVVYYNQYNVKTEERSWDTGNTLMYPILDRWRRELRNITIKESTDENKESS